METAIEWLIDQTRTSEWNSLKRGEIIEIAKEKEKQQIIEAANHGANFDKSPFKNAQDYYDSTFGDNNQAGT